MLSDGIVIQMQADATLMSLVNANSIIPSGAVNKQVWPLIVYHIGTCLDLNDSHGATGNRTARLQLDCYSAKSMREARTIAKAVRNVFKNLNNVVLKDADATFVQSFFITQESDLTMIPKGALTVEYRIMVEVEAIYFES